MSDLAGVGPALSALKLAKEATNGWACYAKRQIEHDEIARLHRDIAELEAAPQDDLLIAAKAVLARFTSGEFRRNGDSDGCSDWAIKAMGPLRDLAILKAAVDKAEGVPYNVREFTE